MRSADDLHARARIRNAAVARFGQDGFRIGLRAIAADAGVSPALIVHHFGSKEQLLKEIVDRAADAFLASATAVPADGDPTQRLAAFIRGHLHVVEHEIETAAVFFHEWTHLPPAARQHVVDEAVATGLEDRARVV